MNPILRRFLSPLLLATLGACSSSVEPVVVGGMPVMSAVERDRVASFQTDSLSYQLRAGSVGYEVEIGVVFTNKSPATAYFQNCGGLTAVSLERLINDKWTPVWTPVIPSCLNQPIVVQPLDSHRITVDVFGGYPGCNCAPQFATNDLTGVYRLVWSQLFSSYKATTTTYSSALPFEMRVSNPFELHAQPR